MDSIIMYELSVVRINHKTFVFPIHCVGKQTVAEEMLLIYFCTVCQSLATRNWMLEKVLGEKEQRSEVRQRLEVRLCDFNVWAKVQNERNFILYVH